MINNLLSRISSLDYHLGINTMLSSLRRYYHKLFVIGFFVTASFGCASLFNLQRPEKSLKEKISDKLYYLTNESQKEKLSRLISDEEIYTLENDVWLLYDPTPQTSQNEFKEIYEERFDHANRYFKECGKEGWKTDRGRIYIFNGHPYDVVREPFIQNMVRDQASDMYPQNLIYSHIMVKEIEVWIYNKPAGSRKFENLFMNLNPGLTQYVFVDMIGTGIYRLMGSTENNDLDDPRIIY
jgi:GWxTD domain-containing protein